MLFTIILIGGFLAWAFALMKISKHGLGFLAGAAVFIAPPAMIRATAMEEVSTWTVFGVQSGMVILLTMMSVLLEGVRNTAQWTAKIKVFDSRWRLLSYGTANLCLMSFFGLFSALWTF